MPAAPNISSDICSTASSASDAFTNSTKPRGRPVFGSVSRYTQQVLPIASLSSRSKLCFRPPKQTVRLNRSSGPPCSRGCGSPSLASVTDTSRPSSWRPASSRSAAHGRSAAKNSTTPTPVDAPVSGSPTIQARETLPTPSQKPRRPSASVPAPRLLRQTLVTEACVPRWLRTQRHARSRAASSSACSLAASSASRLAASAAAASSSAVIAASSAAIRSTISSLTWWSEVEGLACDPVVPKVAQRCSNACRARATLRGKPSSSGMLQRAAVGSPSAVDSRAQRAHRVYATLHLLQLHLGPAELLVAPHWLQPASSRSAFPVPPALPRIACPTGQAGTAPTPPLRSASPSAAAAERCASWRHSAARMAASSSDARPLGKTCTERVSNSHTEPLFGPARGGRRTQEWRRSW
mmetsp:Transcript_93123/g.246180  ORF Transcript_93123/g.246180 Transcript_93123/m.246180 type:complete len:409 (-) Transcript_93123:11-1237(-)